MMYPLHISSFVLSKIKKYTHITIFCLSKILGKFADFYINPLKRIGLIYHSTLPQGANNKNRQIFSIFFNLLLFLVAGAHFAKSEGGLPNFFRPCNPK